MVPGVNILSFVMSVNIPGSKRALLPESPTALPRLEGRRSSRWLEALQKVVTQEAEQVIFE